MKASGLVLLAGFALLVSACETLHRGTEQAVAIDTDPTGADIQLSDGQRCLSPCRLVVPRTQVLTVNVFKAGCLSARSRLSPSVTDDAITLGEISDHPITVGPSLYRTIYDYQLGGAYDITPQPLKIALTCGAAAQRPPLGLTARDKALLAEFENDNSQPALPSDASPALPNADPALSPR